MVYDGLQLFKETRVNPERGSTVNPKHIARILKYYKKEIHRIGMWKCDMSDLVVQINPWSLIGTEESFTSDFL